MKKILPVVIFICSVSSISLFGQTINYNDVGVIVNMNSDTSIAIANYFVAKRHVPAINVIPVYTDTIEEINDTVFMDYYTQITTYLDNNNLRNSLNYLVTTKGCPLKVMHSNANCNFACESELMLGTTVNEPDIFNPICPTGTDISNNNFYPNPYFQQTDTFSQQEYYIYLVTRLDAYTMQNVLDLIDSSGPNTYVNKDSALFVLDQSPNWAGNPLNSELPLAADTLLSRGWRVNLNTDSVYVTYQNNVLGYWSWGSNDGYSQWYTTNAIPHNTWTNASIGETGVSTGGRSFEPGTTYGQSLVADLLAEGCTGVKGYVYEPYTISIAHPDILYPHYTEMNADSTPKYNMAESYFAASQMIGWMDVVIGDPKTSITLKKVAQVAGVKEVANNDWNVYPNPARDYISVVQKQTYPASATISLVDLNGRQIYTRQIASPQSVINVDVRAVPAGVYELQIQTGEQYFSQKVVVIR